jgi:hypothetical protein
MFQTKFVWRNREDILCTVQPFNKFELFLLYKAYVAFVDLLKACDKVNWKVMIKILKMIKIDCRDRRIYKNKRKEKRSTS